MHKRTKKYNDEFAKVKKEILDRDLWNCCIKEIDTKKKCDGKLDVHHIVNRSIGGDNSYKNLITACRRHHSYLHLKEIRERVRECRSILKNKFWYEYNDHFER